MVGRLAGIATIIIFLIPVFLYVAERMPRQSHIQEKNINQNLLLENLNYTHWTSLGVDAQKDYTISAQTLEMDDKVLGFLQVAFLKEMVLAHPQVQFFKQGSIFSTLQAGQARPNMSLSSGDADFINSNEMRFTQRPVLATIEGRTFTCQEMTWNKTDNQIHGEGDCVLNLGTEIVQGRNLVVDINVTPVSLFNHV